MMYFQVMEAYKNRSKEDRQLRLGQWFINKHAREMHCPELFYEKDDKIALGMIKALFFSNPGEQLVKLRTSIYRVAQALDRGIVPNIPFEEIVRNAEREDGWNTICGDCVRVIEELKSDLKLYQEGGDIAQGNPLPPVGE